jgi:hypothetical protein
MPRSLPWRARVSGVLVATAIATGCLAPSGLPNAAAGYSWNSQGPGSRTSADTFVYIGGVDTVLQSAHIDFSPPPGSAIVGRYALRLAYHVANPDTAHDDSLAITGEYWRYDDMLQLGRNGAPMTGRLGSRALVMSMPIGVPRSNLLLLPDIGAEFAGVPSGVMTGAAR